MLKRSCPVCKGHSADVVMTFSCEHLCTVNPSYIREVFEEAVKGLEDHLTYSKCRKCGMVYCENIWSDELLSRVYHDAIDHTLSQNKTLKIHKRAGLALEWHNTLLALRDLGTDLANGIKLIDYGCGWGDFLDAATGHGVQIIGFELDPFKASFAKGRGHRVVDSKQELLDAGPVDVFVLNSVLEHLIDVDEVMQIAGQCLKPRGLLVIEVMDFRARYMRRNSTLLNRGMPALSKILNPIEHVNVFDYKSMRVLLRNHRFVFFGTNNSLSFTRLPFIGQANLTLKTMNGIENISAALITWKALVSTYYANKSSCSQ